VPLALDFVRHDWTAGALALDFVRYDWALGPPLGRDDWLERVSCAWFSPSGLRNPPGFSGRRGGASPSCSRFPTVIIRKDTGGKYKKRSTRGNRWNEVPTVATHESIRCDKQRTRLRFQLSEIRNMQGLNLTSPQKPAKSPDLGTGQASTPFNSTGQSPLNNGPALVGTLAATDVPEGDAASILQQLAQRQQVYNQLGNFAAAMQHEASQADVWRDKLKELECLRVEKRALSADLAAAQAAAQARALEALEVERAVKRQATAREAELQTEKARCRTLEFERQTAVASLEVLRADAARLNGEAAGARALSETNAELTGSYHSTRSPNSLVRTTVRSPNATVRTTVHDHRN